MRWMHRVATGTLSLAILSVIGASYAADQVDVQEIGAARPTQGRILLEPGTGSVADRVAILQLLSLYAHLYDDFEIETWGTLFTEDATFDVAYTGGGPQSRLRWQGREGIVEALSPRRAGYRAEGIQRRHYLTSPIVYQLTADSARVTAHLLLGSISLAGVFQPEGSGRYDGRVVKTPSGWRIKEWTFTPDGAPVDFRAGLQ